MSHVAVGTDETICRVSLTGFATMRESTFELWGLSCTDPHVMHGMFLQPKLLRINTIVLMVGLLTKTVLMHQWRDSLLHV